MKDRAPSEIGTKMKECFGQSFGWFDDMGMSSYEDRDKCFHCELYDRCYQMSLVRQLHVLKFEIRNGVRGIRNSLGGSHSDYPFG